MARLEDLKVEERAEIESTKQTVNGLCHAVLNDLKKSKEVIKFPQPVMLKAGETVANFIARCKSNGADAAEKIIKKVVSEVVYNDVLMTANGTKRGQVNQVFSSLVGIFIGNRQKSEFGDFPG